MTAIRFEWDSRKAAANLRKHGVSFEEAKSVFFDEQARLIDDPDHSKEAQGLSYYAKASIAKRLSMPTERLGQARADLVRFGLIAYEPPLYQVLALDAPAAETPKVETSAHVWRDRFAATRAQLKAAR